jgi:hypothetical protein
MSEYQVSCFGGAEPSDGITHTSRVPEYWAEKAIWLPSGENFGNSSLPTCEVRRVALPPLRGTV